MTPDTSLHSGDQTYSGIVGEGRSIRGYTRQPVPKHVMEEIIEIAQRVPPATTRPANTLPSPTIKRS